jgi:hypothetical protein
MEIPQQTSVVPRVHGAAKTLFNYVQRLRNGLDEEMMRLSSQASWHGVSEARV